MKKQVVHIFGASGSGTSTLGREICRQLGFRFLDTDDFYWMPTDPKFTQKRPPEQRVELMREEILKPGSAVVSGSLVDWGDPLIPLFTLAVRLQADTQLRIQRLKQRERQEAASTPAEICTKTIWSFWNTLGDMTQVAWTCVARQSTTPGSSSSSAPFWCWTAAEIWRRISPR